MTALCALYARNVSGLAPLLFGLWALAVAALAMRACDVDRDDPPLFVREVTR